MADLHALMGVLPPDRGRSTPYYGAGPRPSYVTDVPESLAKAMASNCPRCNRAVDKGIGACPDCDEPLLKAVEQTPLLTSVGADPVLAGALALQAQCAAYVVTKSIGGEGSHGGHVIGHTRSGKPIYSQHNGILPRIRDVDTANGKRSLVARIVQDDDGVVLHEVTGLMAHQYPGKGGTVTASGFDESRNPKSVDLSTDGLRHGQIANAYGIPLSHSSSLPMPMSGPGEAPSRRGSPDVYPEVSKSVDPLVAGALALQAECALVAVRKGAGEGSKGGHVIGHTRSGKPIYSASHDLYTEPHKLSGYNVKTTMLRAHDDTDKRKLARRQFPDYTADDHQDAADAHDREAVRHDDAHTRSLEEAEKGAGSPGFMVGGARHGFMSGGTHADYSPEANDQIRDHSQAKTSARDASRAHRAAAKYFR